MIQFIGIAAAAVAAPAAAGAAAQVWRGVVRGAGRLVEGKPLSAVGELLLYTPKNEDGSMAVGMTSGVLAPFVDMIGNVVATGIDVANVAVYTGARIASIVSPGAAEAIESMGKFDNALPYLVVRAMLPATDGAPPAPLPEDEEFKQVAARAAAVGAGSFTYKGVVYGLVKAA